MSNSRNLASLLRADGSVEPTKYTDEIGGVADFVASGILPNGVPVILNSDGTVSHINTIGALESIPKGTETDAGFGNITYPSVAYDPHTAARVVLTWRDNGLFAAVGTISGTTVTFGTKVRASSGSTGYFSQVHFDPVTPNSFAVIYRGASNYGTMIAGTISGTTVTFGSLTVYASTSTNDFDFAFDPSTSGSFVVSASSSTGLKVYAGTLSGTTLTFGTPVTAKTGNDFRDISVAFDSSIAGNYVLSYENTSTYPNVNFEILAGTVSGTTATTGAVTLVQSVGNGGLFDGNQIFSDSNVPGKFIMAYRYGPSYARVCTVSGNTFTFGTAVQISTATPIGATMRSLYNSSLSSLISTAYYNSNFEMTVSTVSGMTITPATPIIVAAGNHEHFSLSFDTFTSGRFIAFYRNRTGSPNYGATLFGQLATVAAPNLTTETADNFIGISSATYADGETATVTLAGSVSDNQTGLTINSTYYVQTDGTIATTADTPSVELGRAISSTSLLLTSEAGAAPAAVADTALSAYGGTTSEYGIYKVHTFTTSGNFSVTANGGDVDVFIVGAGAAGGGDFGGGGGAGNAYSTSGRTVSPNTNYPITIGGGGVGGTSIGGNGSNTNAFGVVASGGGGGGRHNLATPVGGANGGGGGGDSSRSGAVGSIASYADWTNHGGFSGGNGTQHAGGGGGGAGGAGVAGTTSAAGNGGLGHANDFNGSSLYWAAGGGGGTYGISLGGDGGDGGIGGGGGGSVQQTSESGGTGGSSSLNSGEDGSAGNGHTPTNNSDGGSAGAHTGSGGGGAGYMNMTGGNGASGIVIVRYLK